MLFEEPLTGKCWYQVFARQYHFLLIFSETIGDLIASIIKDFKISNQRNPNHLHLVIHLQLDGFDLVPTLQTNTMLKDGDTIQ